MLKTASQFRGHEKNKSPSAQVVPVVDPGNVLELHQSLVWPSLTLSLQHSDSNYTTRKHSSPESLGFQCLPSRKFACVHMDVTSNSEVTLWAYGEGSSVCVCRGGVQALCKLPKA